MPRTGTTGKKLETKANDLFWGSEAFKDPKTGIGWGADELSQYLNSLPMDKRSQFIMDWNDVFREQNPIIRRKLWDDLYMNKYPDLPIDDPSLHNRMRMLKLAQEVGRTGPTPDFTERFDYYSGSGKKAVTPRETVIRKKIRASEPKPKAEQPKSEPLKLGKGTREIPLREEDRIVDTASDAIQKEVPTTVKNELTVIAKSGNKAKLASYLKSLGKGMLYSASKVLEPLGVVIAIDEIAKAQEKGEQSGSGNLMENFIRFYEYGSEAVDKKAEGEAQLERNKKAFADLVNSGMSEEDAVKEVTTEQIGPRDEGPMTKRSPDDIAMRRSYADSKRDFIAERAKKAYDVLFPRAEEKTNSDFNHQYWMAINNAIDTGDTGNVKINGKLYRLKPEDLELAKNFREESSKAREARMAGKLDEYRSRG